MKIKSLELVGYKRLLLRGIHRFSITPTMIHQLIIGTNGSGKSSVLRELSPLPALSANYVKGGSKTIELEHRGKHYRLVSSFETGNKHYFEVDGEVLNDWGTLSIQKELVQLHFKLDEELFNVLIGDERFTLMQPLTRRAWIIRLSNNDLDYAMAMFNRLKSLARDSQGVVKHLNQRLTQEADKLPTVEQLAEMTHTSGMLKEELTVLMENKELGLPSTQSLDAQLMANVDNLHHIARAVLEKSPIRPACIASAQLTSLQDLDDILHGIKNRLSVNQGMLTHYHQELAKIQEIVDALAKSNADGLDDLKRQIDSLTNERHTLAKEVRKFHVNKNVTQAFLTTIALQPEFNEVFMDLPDNSERLYTKEKRDEKRQRLDSCRNERGQLAVQLGKVQHRLEHIEKAQKEHCPKCGHVWTPGLGEREAENLRLTERTILSKMEQLDREIEDCQHYLEQVQQYIDGIRRFNRMVEANPDLQPLWDYIAEHRSHMSRPKACIPLYNEWRADMEVCKNLAELDEEIRTYAAAYEQASSLGAEGGGHYNERMDMLNADIEKCIHAEQTLRQELREVNTYRETMAWMLKQAEYMGKTAEGVKEGLDLMTRVIRRDVVDETIRDHQSTLAHTENALVQAKALSDIVQDLQVSCQNAQADGDAYKLLTDELSPIDGLIAEQLRGFIDCFVEQINGIIAQIWTYDLKVLACGMDSGELDYKFPMAVNHSDLPVPDVSKSSTSQVDVVDFAFKLVVMLYLELEDYPMYLDELAASMDEQHRFNIMNFVKQLVDTNKCSQMFMISHYHTGHGVFTNAEICVMDDANIVTMPEHYNRHVVME